MDIEVLRAFVATRISAETLLPQLGSRVSQSQSSTSGPELTQAGAVFRVQRLRAAKPVVEPKAAGPFSAHNGVENYSLALPTGGQRDLAT
ncbi:hypothetical protein [Aureimonas glaciei]|uniref:hypothetical protein n=1 Tax=Aureimonas glaciei TaxID=1776957 RepID=UPI001662B217|nr:hypothetical protein [Aureimonas glaciei]